MKCWPNFRNSLSANEFECQQTAQKPRGKQISTHRMVNICLWKISLKVAFHPNLFLVEMVDYHLKNTQQRKTVTFFFAPCFLSVTQRIPLLSKKLRILIFHVHIKLGQCFDVDWVSFFGLFPLYWRNADSCRRATKRTNKC